MYFALRRCHFLLIVVCGKTLYLHLCGEFCVCVYRSVCCFCVYYALPHIWLCLLCHSLLVFVCRPAGWSPQRSALALSQARLQQLSQSLHNTKHCTGMLLLSFFPFSSFFFSFSLPHSTFVIEFLILKLLLVHLHT